MGIREAALAGFVAGLSIYAYRHWFRSLCGLIVLMAVMQHPDMPKGIMGIQGLNPWNMLFFNVLAGWLLNRRREGLLWDMPRHINVLLLAAAGVVVIGFARLMMDRSNLELFTGGYLFSEYFINTVKWVIPGLLLFDGCRSRERLVAGLACVLAVYFLFAVQVIRWMPPGSVLTGAELTVRSRKLIMNEVGYHAVNMSMMLSGASWAILATAPLANGRGWRLLIVMAALTVAYGQALTAGRMGYVTWIAVGFILSLMRWRKYLVLIPVLLLLITLTVPGAVERMLQGFSEQSVAGETALDDYQVTSGRTLIWPHVMDKIAESPVIGFGRNGMVRTGLSAYLFQQLGEEFGHPHNAYLECLLDNGVVGCLLLFPLYGVLVHHAGHLFLDRRRTWYSGVGGLCLALLLALLIASTGSQTFYPREGSVGMWCAVGLMLRVWVERERASVWRAVAEQEATAIPCIATGLKDASVRAT